MRTMILAAFALALMTSPVLAASDASPTPVGSYPSALPEGGSPKHFVTGGPLPKYCTRSEMNAAIAATVAATKDIPIGNTAEFVRKANAVAASYGC